jgi:hypothetical protein
VFDGITYSIRGGSCCNLREESVKALKDGQGEARRGCGCWEV